MFAIFLLILLAILLIYYEKNSKVIVNNEQTIDNNEQTIDNNIVNNEQTIDNNIVNNEQKTLLIDYVKSNNWEGFIKQNEWITISGKDLINDIIPDNPEVEVNTDLYYKVRHAITTEKDGVAINDQIIIIELIKISDIELGINHPGFEPGTTLIKV